MQQIKFAILYLLIISSMSAKTQIHIKVVQMPPSTNENIQLFIAGNFNNWNPSDTNFLLKKDKEGVYGIHFSTNLKEVEFKFTQGSWEKVEGTADGGQLPNRKMKVNSKVKKCIITGWEGEQTICSTSSNNVHIIDGAFFMPQLNKNRKISIYLPPNYENSDKKYPVLYMHDGQNLFDDSTSYSGEWKLMKL